MKRIGKKYKLFSIVKNEDNGITLVALVITIIILIILAGISINTLIGENGIITKTKEARQNIMLAGEAEALQLNQLYYELETGGELTEDEESAKKDEIIALLQKQVEELQNQVGSLQTENEDLRTQITDLNKQIADLQAEIESLRNQISQKDIEIADLKAQVSEKEAKIQELQNQLNAINSLLTQTNATADKILAGYKAYSGGQLLTGTMVNRGAVSSSLNCGQSYTIPAGYHNGSGKVTANSLTSQTSATATAADILSGKTAWVNGTKLTGTNQGYDAGYNDGISKTSLPEIIILHFNNQFSNTSINYVPAGNNVYDKLEKVVDQNILSISGTKIIANKNCNIAIYGSSHTTGGTLACYVYKNTTQVASGNNRGMVATFSLSANEYIQFGVSNTQAYWNEGSFTIVAWV